MAFRPDPNDILDIDGVEYSVAEHTAAPGMPYGQEGRAATVYKVLGEEKGEERALKVFKRRYQVPSLVSLARRLEAFADIPGLKVCHRQVITARKHTQLVRQHPDLAFAVLMPWIEGPTWMEVLFEGREISPEQSLSLARALVDVLAEMEERGLAHCDLSGPNILLPALYVGHRDGVVQPVELVDVEQLFGPGLDRPEAVPAGSSGYAHQDASGGVWEAAGDRFAGAIIVAEVLCWCDARVREAAWGESYFDPDEMQKRESSRYEMLLSVLRARWGEAAARLFEQVWSSDSLQDCPALGAWLAALPDGVLAQAKSDAIVDLPTMPAEAEESVGSMLVKSYDQTTESPVSSVEGLQSLLAEARMREREGNLGGALAPYREALALAKPGSGMHSELSLIVSDIEEGLGKEGIVVAPDGSKVDALFDDGLRAYRRSAWRQAEELFAEVVRQRPGYKRGGQAAADLLATIRARLTSISGARTASGEGRSDQAGASEAPLLGKRSLGAMLIPALVVIVLLVFGGIAIAILGGQSRATNQAQSTATPHTAGGGAATTVTPKDDSSTVRDVQGQLTGTAIVGAGKTSTALAEAQLESNQTAQADKTAQAFGSAQAVQASQTAEALAMQGATAQTQATSQAQLDQVATVQTLQAQQIQQAAQQLSQQTSIVQTVQAQVQATSQAQMSAQQTSAAMVQPTAQSPRMPPTTKPPDAGATAQAHANETAAAQATIQAKQAATSQAQQAVTAQALQVLSQQSTAQALSQASTAQAILQAKEAATAQAAQQRATTQAEQQATAQARLGATSTAQALAAPLRAFFGHTEEVQSVAFSPDGQTLVSGSSDKTIKLWMVSDGAQIRTLSGHTNDVLGVAFSPDGQTIASGSFDGTIKLWNVSDGSLIRTLTGHNSEVQSVAFSPDGQTLASAAHDRKIKLWSMSDGSLLRTLSGHTNGVESVDFSPDGQTIASGSSDHTIILWSFSDGSLLRILSGHTGRVESVAFSPDGQTIASGGGSFDNTIKMWQVSDGALLRTLSGHTGRVESVAFSPDGQTIASGSNDNTIKLWKASDGSLMRTLSGHASLVGSVVFSPDGQTIASGSYDKTIKVWQVR